MSLKDNRFFKYLREVRHEMKKVVWPGRDQTIVYTMVVVVTVAVAVAGIWVVDEVLSRVLGVIIR